MNIKIYVLTLKEHPERLWTFIGGAEAMGLRVTEKDLFYGHYGMAYDSVDDVIDAAIEDGFESLDANRKLLRAMHCAKSRIACRWSYDRILREAATLVKPSLIIADDVLFLKDIASILLRVSRLNRFKCVGLMRGEHLNAYDLPYGDDYFKEFFGLNSIKHDMPINDGIMECVNTNGADAAFLVTPEGAQEILESRIEYPLQSVEAHISRLSMIHNKYYCFAPGVVMPFWALVQWKELSSIIAREDENK